MSISYLRVLSILLLSCLIATAEPKYRMVQGQVNLPVQGWGGEYAFQVVDADGQETPTADWEVSDPQIGNLRVENGRGLFKPKAAGHATLTAYAYGEALKAQVTVWAQEPPQPLIPFTIQPIGRFTFDVHSLRLRDETPDLYLEDSASGRTLIRAFDFRGNQVWVWPSPGSDDQPSTLCADNLGGVLVWSGKPGAYVLVSITDEGKERWRTPVKQPTRAKTVVHEGTIFIVEDELDGTASRVVVIDDKTGERKHEYALPGSEEVLVNARRKNGKLFCAPQSRTTRPLPLLHSRMFSDYDSRARVAVTSTAVELDAGQCAEGTVLRPERLRGRYQQALYLISIGVGGDASPALVEQTVSDMSGGDLFLNHIPTGGLIPDGHGGYLVAMRHWTGKPGNSPAGKLDDLVYRVTDSGKLVYRLSAPSPSGKLEDDMVLGERDTAFLTRGKTAMAWEVASGKELWRWEGQDTGLGVQAALEDGSVLLSADDVLLNVMDGKLRGSAPREYLIFGLH